MKNKDLSRFYPNAGKRGNDEFLRKSDGGSGSGLPAVTTDDNGKMLQVESGEWKVKKYPFNISYLFNNDVMSSDENASPPIINVIDLPEDADLTNMSTWKVYVNDELMPWNAEEEDFLATDHESYYRFLYVGMDPEDPTTYKKAILEVGNIVDGEGVPIVDTFRLIIKLSDTIDENFATGVKLASNVLVVRITYDSDESTYKSDTSYTDIIAAYDAGKAVFANCDGVTVPLAAIERPE